MWTTKKLLVWGKTYPEFSKKHYETVCTGAIDGETGQLLRIYPITLRHMTEPFRLYQWIEGQIATNPKDRRPESFRIEQTSIRPLDWVSTKDGWAERSKWVLGHGNVFRSVEHLRAAQADDGTSLGLVRPREITRVYCKKKPDDERAEWEEQRNLALQQREIFVDAESETKDLVYMPVEYRIRFRCDDPACNEHDMSIRDWGVYALSRKQYAIRGAIASEKDVIAKIEEMMDPAKRDAYFFLGNLNGHPQSFMIVGFYYPPRRPIAPESGEADGELTLPGIG
jgi:hypothetical protein